MRAQHRRRRLAEGAGRTSWAKSTTTPSSTFTSTVTFEPHSLAIFSALASGAASRPARGMSAASLRILAE